MPANIYLAPESAMKQTRPQHALAAWLVPKRQRPNPKGCIAADNATNMPCSDSCAIGGASQSVFVGGNIRHRASPLRAIPTVAHHAVGPAGGFFGAARTRHRLDNGPRD
jgi:hypothetical protein